MKAPKAVQVALAQLRLDGGTQSRVALSEDTIADYAAAYADGVEMPPVGVVFEAATQSHWLWDGFHREAGARRAKVSRLPAVITPGTLRDAILLSVGANARHGLRRTNADKQRAVEVLIRDQEWGARSDAWIGETAGVDHKTVAAVRARLGISHPEVAQARDGKGYRIQKKRAGEAEGLFTESTGQRRRVSVESSASPAEVPPEDLHVEREPGEDDDAPDAEPAIDMRGLPASEDWIANVGAVLMEMELMDQDLREARKSIANLAKLGMHGTHVEALKVALANALHEVEQRTPVAPCRFCGDPDGAKGKRATCGACLGAGYTVRSQEPGAAVPAKIRRLSVGVKADVAEPSNGRESAPGDSSGSPAVSSKPAAPRNRIVLEREDGTEAAYDPTEAA